MTVVELGDEKIGGGGRGGGGDCCHCVRDWNDDEVTQEPLSRTCGFSLLVINCQSTGGNCKPYSKPMRANIVCVHACASLCS